MLNLTNSAIWISPQAIAAISNTTSMIPTLILNENYSDYPANEYGLLYYSNVTELLLPPSSVMPATNVSTAKRKNATRSSATFEVPIWLIACYSVILLCAVIGNLLVISTLVQNRRMRTITNVFLLNLAISDILLGVLCMPVTLVGTLLRHFIFGEFCCKLIQFSQAASVAVSSWTLVAISCERYYAICHPLSSRRWQTRRHAYKIIACIWLGSVVCMSPIAIFSKLMPTSRQGFKKCRENWPSFALAYERPYNIFLDIILLILPLVILSIAYILITRTLYVSICMEKTMVFGSRRNDKPAQQQQHQQSQLTQHAYLPTTSHVSEEESEERDRVERIEMEHEMLCATTTAGKLSFQIGHTVPIQQHHPPETLRARLKLNLLSRSKSKTPASTTLMSTAAAAASNMFDVHLDKPNNKQQTETDVLYNEQSSQHQFSVVNHRQQYMPSRALSYSLNNNQQKLQQQQPNYSQQHHQYNHQHQPQQQHHHHHHHSDMPHNVENDCRTKFSCDYLMRFCCKCILPSSSLAASSSSAFPVATTPVTTSSSSSYVAREHKHLYCMRFATLKTLPNSEMGNCSMSGGYSSSGCNTSAATINGNSSNNSCGNNSEQQQQQQLSQGMATSSSTYRMQLQQQQQYHLSKSSFVQHDVSSYCCCCKEAETKRNFSTKRINLSKTSSVLRRNNIAKNLQSKKRVVKMLSVLVLEFFICWTPLYVLNTVAMYIGAAIYEYIDYTSISVLQLLAYSSSCCNPITYCFMNANFRRAFLDTFKGLHWCNLDYFKSNSKTQSKNMKQKVNLYMVDNNSSMRGNSCTVQSVIVESPRL